MLIVYILIGYALSGLIFSLVFLLRLIKRFDEGAVDAPWTFKVIILPGCMALWPVLLIKYLKMRKNDRG